jgi:histidinol-phosphatase (PHP family)
MTLRTNYHTHSRYCDGVGEIEEYVQAAIAAGFDSYGVSCHAPVPIYSEGPYMMLRRDLPTYCNEVGRLRRKYRDQIDLLLGLELDYAPGLEAYYEQRIRVFGFDYFVGSVHYVGTDDVGVPWCIDETADRFAEGLGRRYNGDVRPAIEEYFALQRQMVGTPGVAIVGHMDKIKMWNSGEQYFRETDDWYVAAIDETLRAFKAGGLIVELNTRGIYKLHAAPYPSPWVMARCRDLGIPVMVNADTHAPSEVNTGYAEAAAILRDAGITNVMAWDGDAFSSRPV